MHIYNLDPNNNNNAQSKPPPSSSKISTQAFSFEQLKQLYTRLHRSISRTLGLRQESSRIINISIAMTLFLAIQVFESVVWILCLGLKVVLGLYTGMQVARMVVDYMNSRENGERRGVSMGVSEGDSWRNDRGDIEDIFAWWKAKEGGSQTRQESSIVLG